jgi:hypothetical protein
MGLPGWPLIQYGCDHQSRSLWASEIECCKPAIIKGFGGSISAGFIVRASDFGVVGPIALAFRLASLFAARVSPARLAHTAPGRHVSVGHPTDAA